MTLPQVIRAIRTSRKPLVVAMLTLGLFSSSALAQSSSFQLRITEGNNVFLVPNGSTLTLAPSAVGQVSTATLTAIYVGATSALISAQPVVLGSTNFTVSSLPNLPLTLLPNQSFDLTLQFKPTSPATALAQLNVGFVESQQSTAGGVPTSVAGTIQLNLTGTAPNLLVSYFLQTNGNVLPLTNGSSLIFPPTVVASNTAATLIIANRGSGAGLVNGLSVSGTAFQPLGLPLPPFSIPPGTDVRFVINYTPTQVATDTGTLTIDLGGNSFTTGLTGSGINAGFSYQVLTSTGSVPFLANQTVSLPDTLVGTTASVTVRVQNTGTAAGTISAITAGNGPFTVTDVPLTPVTLKPSDILTFTLNFIPTQTGKNTGNLRIGNDLFTLAGNGLGPKLDFSYGAAPVTVVQAGGAVIFSPLQVGQSASLPFTVTNHGTTVGRVASVAVADTHGVFTVTNLPGLPATLNPGDSFTFTISFAPATTGIATSVLQVDTQSFNLSGSGSQPPPLPAVQFTGASGTVDAFTQPAIGLSLASPYALAVSGILTITTASASFNPDPAVQFATGGVKVSFTIPANSTDAVFPIGGNRIRLQSGTTAGTITITAGLATSSGLDLTPSPAPAVSLTVASSAPHLLSVVLASQSTTGFSLQVTGFSTTRSLTTLNFQFTAASGGLASNGSVSVDVSGAAANWYSSSQSQSFGGQFSVTIPFTLKQGSTTSTSLVSKIQSVAVTAGNSQGTSNSLSTPISP